MSVISSTAFSAACIVAVVAFAALVDGQGAGANPDADKNLKSVPNAQCKAKPATCFDTCWEKCFSCPLKGFALHYQAIYNIIMQIKSFREVFNARAIGVALDITQNDQAVFEYQQDLAAMAVLASTGGVGSMTSLGCDSIFIANYTAKNASYVPSHQCLTPCQASQAISGISKYYQVADDWLGGACVAAATAMMDPTLPCTISNSDRVLLLAFINSNPQATALDPTKCTRFAARASVNIHYQALLRAAPKPYTGYLKPSFSNLNITDVYNIYKKNAARGILNCMRKSCCSSTSSARDAHSESNRAGKVSSSPVFFIRKNGTKGSSGPSKDTVEAMESQWQRGLDFSIDYD